MTVLLDARSLKALQIAATASAWTRLVGRAFYIPSQTNPAQCYVTSPDTCQCPDSDRHPSQLCKHSIAVSIVLALIETQPEAVPSPSPSPRPVLEMVRHEDGEVSWQKRSRTADLARRYSEIQRDFSDEA